MLCSLHYETVNSSKAHQATALDNDIGKAHRMHPLSGHLRTFVQDISGHFRVRLSCEFSNISCCSHFCLQSPCLVPRCCGSERGSLKGSWARGVQCCGVVSLLLRAVDPLVLEPQGLVQIELLALLLLVGWLSALLKVFPQLLLLFPGVDPAFLVPPPLGPGDGMGPMRFLGSYILHSSVHSR